ncbi:MAG: response regulator [Desulfobacterales bacterium]|nr:response regulator [Desulfobacterales bacterium]
MPKARSLSNSLMIGLVAGIILVSLVSLLLSNVYISEKAEAQLALAADRNIGLLCEILEEPLWDYNIAAVKKIGRTFAVNQKIARVRITDDSGTVRYLSEKEDSSGIMERTADVSHEGRKIGRVEIAMNPGYFSRLKHDMLKTSLMVVAVLLMCLPVAAWLMVRFFLQRPLSDLSNIIKAFARGNFNPPEQATPVREFEPVVTLLRSMGRKISDQMQELQNQLEERRKAEEALGKSKKLLQETQKITAVGGWEYELSSGRLTWTEETYRIYGVSPAEYDPNDVDRDFAFYTPGDQEKIETAFKKTVREGTPYDMELRFVNASGENLWVRTSGKAEVKEGRVVRVYGNIMDITKQKKYEERLRQAQKMEAVGTLAGGIAHDFNNILNAIIGYAELIRLEATGKAGDYTEEVLQAGRRAAGLVRQILTFSRQAEQEYQRLYIQFVLKEALKLLRPTLPATIEINQNIDEDCPEILADPTQVHQVIMNLCTNAYQAMGDKGGRLEITLEQLTLAAGDLSLAREMAPGSYVVLTVSDTGCGMDRQTWEKIFEPYFSTKKNQGGTGLGLAVVHGIVTDCGGSISVYSEPGRGTTFKVYLPAVGGGETPQAEDLQVAENIPEGTERLLIVDDEKAQVDMERIMLESLGYLVTGVVSSIEALAVFSAQPEDYDLLITDLAMPELDGIELSRKVLGRRPDLPVILISGFGDAPKIEEARAAGIREYLRKPVAKMQLARAVRKVLDGARADR